MTWRRWSAPCFGLGRLPVAPGSWGSLPPAIVFGLLMYCCVPGWVTAAVMAVMLGAGCATCVLYAPASMAATGRNDPGEVVMDEFAGQALTFLVMPLVMPRDLCGWGRLPAGWGILVDDLAAGIVSAILVYIAMSLLVRV